MKCLWCGKEIADNYFCPKGGRTNYPSKTGEQTMTKSYCMDSFLTMYKSSIKNKTDFIKSEMFYIDNVSTIKEWYKSIPLVFEKT